jgi:dynein heavy chain
LIRTNKTGNINIISAAMIHWARQIKEVLTTQDAFEMAENSGPLDEIQFWKDRCSDLTGN